MKTTHTMYYVYSVSNNVLEKGKNRFRHMSKGKYIMFCPQPSLFPG